MADHIEINQFFEEILHVLVRVVPQHADVVQHVAGVRTAVDRHKAVDKYAEALDQLTDTDIEELVRFVERPGNRHHIAETEKIWDAYGAEQAGRILLKHFYEHNKNHLIHAEKLKHLH